MAAAAVMAVMAVVLALAALAAARPIGNSVPTPASPDQEDDGHAHEDGRECETAGLSAAQIRLAALDMAAHKKAHPAAHAKMQARANGRQFVLTAEQEIIAEDDIVPVYFHVIQDSEGKGALTNEQVAAQIEVLNTAFQPAGFRFALAETIRTTSDAWANLVKYSPAEAEMKTALRRGTADTLNIYSTNLPSRSLGWATFPQNYAGAPHMDGVVVRFDTLPGVNETSKYNRGYTATHEVGHWLGLLHTFEGGCTAGFGDGVNDTPAQATGSTSCAKRDSCWRLPGTDDVSNFMDYSPDSCMDHFTPGQNERMNAEYATYRRGK